MSTVPTAYRARRMSVDIRIVGRLSRTGTHGFGGSGVRGEMLVPPERAISHPATVPPVLHQAHRDGGGIGAGRSGDGHGPLRGSRHTDSGVGHYSSDGDDAEHHNAWSTSESPRAAAVIPMTPWMGWYVS